MMSLTCLFSFEISAGTVCKGDGEEKWNPETNRELPPDSCRPSMNDIIQKDDGLIVFFPGRKFIK